jgi:hypothetical protein
VNVAGAFEENAFKRFRSDPVASCFARPKISGGLLPAV